MKIHFSFRIVLARRLATLIRITRTKKGEEQRRQRQDGWIMNESNAEKKRESV